MIESCKRERRREGERGGLLMVDVLRLMWDLETGGCLGESDQRRRG